MTDNKSKPSYYAFILSTGGIEYFTNTLEALQFQTENADLIRDSRKFVRKVDFERFKAKPPTNIVIDDDARKASNNPSSGLTAAERAILDKCLLTVEEETPANRVEWYYKAHSKSTIAVGIGRVINKNGKDDWRIKGQPFAVALRAHAQYFPDHTNTPEVKECFKNIHYAEQRDPEGDCKKVLSNPWKSSSGKKFDFPQHVMWTFFKLPPCTQFKNQEEENVYIEEVFHFVTAAIKRMVKTESFATTYKRAINKDSMWDSITKEDRHFRLFFEDCRSKVREAFQFIDHVVQKESTIISTQLYNSRQATLKYPPVEEAPPSDEESVDSNKADRTNTSVKHAAATVTPNKRSGPTRAAAASKQAKTAAA